MCNSSPDTSGMNAAALANAQISQQALDWYKQKYAETQPQRDQANKIALDTSQQQLAASKQNQDIANDYYNYQTSTYRPLEQSLVTSAQNYDTPAREEAAANRAGADVRSAFDTNNQALMRNITRTGTNMTSGAALALQSGNQLAEAKAEAGAENQARLNTQQQGYAREMDAASLGRNLPSQQATSQQVATQTGNSAVTNAVTPTTVNNAGVGMMGQGFNTAIQGNQSAANIYGQIAGITNQSNQQNMEGLAGLGQAAGMFLYASDENVKDNTDQTANTKKALDQVEQTPVMDGWTYNPTKGGPDDGGQPHIGPMAQMVRKNMGDQVAPGGKAIDMVNMNGKLMAGMQELSKRVKKIEKKVAA